MKVSNNALNFLLAQYRAIFKRAYVKGLASAVLLTAGLAAGASQAQAANITDGSHDSLTGTAEVTVDGTGTKITISGTATTGTTIDWSAPVKITGGSTSENYIHGENGVVTINNNSGTLTINTTDSGDGLGIVGHTNGVTIELQQIDVTKGTLSIEASGSGASVSANTINVGTVGQTEATAHSAILSLIGTTDQKIATLGGENSVINIFADGQLQATTESGTVAIKGAQLNLGTGALFLSEAGTASGDTITIESRALNADSGSVHVIYDDSKAFTEEFTGQTATLKGHLLVGQSGTLTLNPKLTPDTDEERLDGIGTVTLAKGSNTVVTGTINVNNGTLIVKDGAQLNATAATAKIALNGNGTTTEGTLRISSDALEDFIEGSGDKYVKINNDGTLDATADQTGNKALFVLSGGRIELTDKNEVDLATKFFFSGGSSAGLIQVDSTSGGTIYGQNLTISKSLANDAAGTTKLTSGSNLTVEAINLTLGSKSLAKASEIDLGVAEAKAKNLTLLSEDNELTLVNKVTLSATREVPQGDNIVIEGDTGTITGNFIISGGATNPFTVEHGSYTNKGNITVSGGELHVSNKALGDNSDQFVDTTFEVTGNFKLVANAASKIIVDGDNLDASGAATVLDLTGTTLSLESGTASATVEANDGGTIVLKGSQLTTLLTEFGSSNSGAKVSVSGGTIHIEDSVTLDASNIVTTAADHKLAFTGTGGAGTLEVENELTLNNVSNLSLGGESGEIVAGILNLNNGDTAAKLTSGSYTAIRSLTSNGTAGVSVDDTASVFLGEVESAGNNIWVANGGGNLNTNLEISHANGSVTVAAGDWTGGKNITVTAGNLYVGSVDTANSNAAYLDADGEAITASLALGNLSIAAGGKTTVYETGTLTTKGFTSAGSQALTVDGTVTINGKADTASTPTPNYNYGIDIGSGSVDVNAGGQLRLTGYAITALGNTTADASGNFFTTASNSYDADGITVNAGGEVYFDFAEGTTLSADALTDLRAALFDTQADGTVAGSINIGAATISGIAPEDDGKYDWNKLQGIGDVLTNFTFDELKAGVVKNIETGDQVRGHFGALESSTIAQGGKINIVGNSSLNAAANGQFATGLNGAQLGLNVAQGVRMDLNNGGAIGEISLAQDSTLGVNTAAGITNPGKTTIAAIDGVSGVAEFGVGEVEVTGETRVANLVTSAQGVATFGGDVTVGSTGSKLETDLLGTNTFNGAATFNTNTEIGDGSTATFNKSVEFAAGANIYGNTAVTGGAEFGAYTEIGGNATLTADSIELTQATAGNEFRFVVGEEDYIENGQTMPGSTGYLQAKSVTLNGNTLVVDPSYDHATSVAAIEGFADAVNNDDDAGTFDGTIFVGQNAALGVGQGITIADVQSFIKQYQNSRGALIQDQVGSIMYIDGMLTAADGSRIILDSQHTQAQVFSTRTTTGLIDDGKTYWGAYTENGVTTNHEADLYLGQNTILAVSDAILDDGAAVHFEKGDAAIMAQKVTDAEDAAKIVLDGNGFLGSRDVTLFTDTGAGANTGVKVLGDQDIRVETLNGVMYFMLEAGTEVTGDTLKLDTTKLNTAFSGATAESRELLFAYTSQTENFREFYADENQTGANAGKVAQVDLHGDVASSDIVTLDPTTGNAKLTDAAAASGKYDVNNYVVVLDRNDKGEAIKNDKGEYVGTVYNRAHNDLLEAIARNTNGAATDSAALQGVFGGAAQAALLAARTSQETVAGRTGVGASSSALTFADNGQGAGLWVNPIYVSQDSDGFEVSNKEYGVDIDLYGVALGGDYTLANGVRVGAFFNVGSGEADGNGQASGVSNDFDYYGVGLYAGYSVGQFSVVGDVSYSVVDSEIDASTAVGKITSSFDTENLSIGVTGQYEFDFNGTLVTPHVGLRYSALSVDDYSFEGAGYSRGGEASIDDANVFSIPVGVTVAKEFAFNTWTVKPSLDVTVQGNFGDDELDSTAEWDNVAWQSNYSSEFIDNFTYGATLGVAAKTGSFSAGIGLGYQGSSNTDEFSATANARFVF